MSVFLSILKFLMVLPKFIDQLREAYWLWETSRVNRQKERAVDENNKIHDDIANGGRPKWDNRN